MIASGRAALRLCPARRVGAQHRAADQRRPVGRRALTEDEEVTGAQARRRDRKHRLRPLSPRAFRGRGRPPVALAERDVLLEEPLLDDIDVGDLEGETLEAYRAWKHSHAREVPFPGGESLDDAALRYALAFRRLLEAHDTVLVVTHEIPIRYALNGASGSDSLDGPAHEVENAVAYLFDDEALARAADGIEGSSPGRLARVPTGEPHGG